MAKLKFVTIGSATFDAFLAGEQLAAKRDVRSNDEVEQFPLGAKVEIDEVVFSTGGGATNAAVTFVRGEQEATFLGKIGDDLAGREVLNALKNEGVSTSRVVCDINDTTGFSVILLAPSGERTVLVNRGVSETLYAKDFDFKTIKADWLYITSLAGNLELLAKVLQWASKKQIKVAYNPGSEELKQAAQLRPMLKQLTILIANQGEMEKLFGKAAPLQLMLQAATHVHYAVMTFGAKGSLATDGISLYKSGLYHDVKVIDRTGAGDAFGSGFTLKLATGGTVPEAITYGSANSTSVVRHVGAKAGILEGALDIKSMKIRTLPLKP